MRIRPPAVAGMFYPGEEKSLLRMVDGMLADARRASLPAVPKALIAPHAGYVYSGPIAASAYALLAGLDIRRVVLLGPTHRAYIHGLALPDADAFATPLGTIELDRELIDKVAGLPQVLPSANAHALEHSLEVHLPFLQRAIKSGFKLVPLAVGDATPEQVAEVLTLLWQEEATLFVISSDLSHYLPYDEARAVDRATADAILALQWPIHHDQACGATPINGLLALAEKQKLTPHLLDLRNSGDTAGDKSQVVGYGAFAFTAAHA